MRLTSSVVIKLIRPVGLCFATVLVTTLALSTIDSFVPTEHLMLGYLLPAVLVVVGALASDPPRQVRVRADEVIE